MLGKFLLSYYLRRCAKEIKLRGFLMHEISGVLMSFILMFTFLGCFVFPISITVPITTSPERLNATSSPMLGSFISYKYFWFSEFISALASS